MAIKVPNVGEIILLDYIRLTLNGTPHKMKLFKNDYTPVDGSVIGDFTEANFSGYAEATIGGFNAPQLAAGKAKTTGDPETFTHNGGATANDIYGFYITDNAGSTLLWAERASDAPLVMSANGHKIIATPQLTLSTEV